MFCVRHDHVTSAQSRAELLSEQPGVLRECFGTILKQQKYSTVNSDSQLQAFRNKKRATVTSTKPKKNTPLDCPDHQVSSTPTVSSEICPGTPQPDRSCNTELMNKTAGLCLEMCVFLLCVPTGSSEASEGF